MQYPPHLLPRQHFKIIPFEAWMNACFLLHHTKDRDLFDPETALLKLDYIVLNTDHLKDFSTNLLGTFRYEDCYWSVNKERMDAFFGENWLEGEAVECPSPDDCGYHEERGAFYLSIERFAGKEVRSTGDDEITTICDVLHTPIRCNYWHFSLRWKDENGDYFQDLRPKRIRIFFKMWVKRFIQENAIFDLPEYQPIPPEKYEKN
jgi:hypothetical protein